MSAIFTTFRTHAITKSDVLINPIIGRNNVATELKLSHQELRPDLFSHLRRYQFLRAGFIELICR